MVVVVSGSRYHHFLFAPLITFPDCAQFRVSLDRVSPRVDHVYIKTWIRGSKSQAFPGFDSDVVFRGAMIRVLR